MPAYRLATISPAARTAALRALDDALSAPATRHPASPLSAAELREIDIIDDALDHLLAPQLPR
jgi:predicted nucleic acid-binding Zn ribbon protein